MIPVVDEQRHRRKREARPHKKQASNQGQETGADELAGEIGSRWVIRVIRNPDGRTRTESMEQFLMCLVMPVTGIGRVNPGSGEGAALCDILISHFHFIFRPALVPSGLLHRRARDAARCRGPR